MKLKSPTLIYFLVVFLLGCLLIQYPHNINTNAQPITQSSKEQKLFKQLQDHQIIYLGERHDRIEDHNAQLKIITQLHHQQKQSKTTAMRQNLRYAIALEMFQRQFQPVLDSYLAGKISETQLREQTEFDSRWGFNWEFYAPILRFAQANQIPLIALNTPTEITFKVAKDGLNSLKGKDLEYIPPINTIKIDNQAYRQQLQSVYQQHAESDHGNSDNFDNFFAAQVLWEETMAEAIASYYQNQPQAQIIVLVGLGHIHDYGIPSRVARRVNQPSLRQRRIFLDSF